MKTVAKGQITMTDLTDGQLYGYLASNLPKTQLFSSSKNTFSPDWTATPLQIVPNTVLNQESISINELTVNYKKQIGTNPEEELDSTYEKVNGNILTVNKNELYNIEGNTITYIAYITYKNFEIRNDLTFTMLLEGEKGADGEPGKDGENGVGYTVVLTNEAYVFKGESQHAILDEAETQIQVYKDTSRINVAVLNVNGVSANINKTNTGIPGLDFKVSTISAVEEPAITFYSSTELVQTTGSLAITFSADGKTWTKFFSYGIALKGEGAAINIVADSQIFKSGDGGFTFSPEVIKLTPLLTNINFGKWQRSIDKGLTWQDITNTTATTTAEYYDANTKVLTIPKNTVGYSKENYSIIYKLLGNEEQYYDLITISRVYDNSEIQATGDNLLLNSNFKQLRQESLTYHTEKNNNLYATDWSGYNAGITNSTKDFHAFVNNYSYDFNVMEFNESAGSRAWKGISQSVGSRLENKFGQYSFSADLKPTAEGTKLFGGFYYYKKNGTTTSFWDGQFNIVPDSTNWKRYSITINLGEEVDFERDVRFYIYGYGFSTNSILHVTNVKLAFGNFDTGWTAAPKDTTALTDSSFNLINNSSGHINQLTLTGDTETGSNLLDTVPITKVSFSSSANCVVSQQESWGRTYYQLQSTEKYPRAVIDLNNRLKKNGYYCLKYNASYTVTGDVPSEEIFIGPNTTTNTWDNVAFIKSDFVKGDYKTGRKGEHFVTIRFKADESFYDADETSFTKILLSLGWGSEDLAIFKKFQIFNLALYEITASEFNTNVFISQDLLRIKHSSPTNNSKLFSIGESRDIIELESLEFYGSGGTVTREEANFTLTGTVLSEYSRINIIVPKKYFNKKTKYTVLYEAGEGFGRMAIGEANDLYDTTTYSIYATSSTAKTHMTFRTKDLSKNYVNFYFYAPNLPVGEVFTLNNFSIIEEFGPEPYQEHGTSFLKLKSVSKNLFNKNGDLTSGFDGQYWRTEGSTVDLQDDGKIKTTVNTSATVLAGQIIKVKPKTSYTLSAICTEIGGAEDTVSNASLGVIYLYEKGLFTPKKTLYWSKDTLNQRKTCTYFNESDSRELIIGFGRVSNASHQSTYAVYDLIQFEESTEASSFVEYEETLQEVPLPTPLRGNAYYRDIFQYSKGVASITQKLTEIKLTSATGCSISNLADGSKQFYYSPFENQTYGNNSRKLIYSNKFQAETLETRDSLKDSVYSYSGDAATRIATKNIATIAEMQTLADEGHYIIYGLASTVEHALNPTFFNTEKEGYLLIDDVLYNRYYFSSLEFNYDVYTELRDYFGTIEEIETVKKEITVLEARDGEIEISVQQTQLQADDNAQEIGKLSSELKLTAENLTYSIAKGGGTNLLRNSAMQDGKNYWLDSLSGRFTKGGSTPPTSPEPMNNDLWYCSSPVEGYEQGVVYKYSDGVWYKTAFNLEQAEADSNLLSCVEPIEDDYSKRYTDSGIILNFNAEKVGTHLFSMTDFVSYRENEDYITASFKFQNKIQTGVGLVGIAFSDQENGDGFRTGSAGLDQQVQAYYYQDLLITPTMLKNDLSDITLTVKVPKKSDFIGVTVGPTPPDSSEEYWLAYTEVGLYLNKWDSESESWVIVGDQIDEKGFPYSLGVYNKNSETKEVYFRTKFANGGYLPTTINFDTQEIKSVALTFLVYGGFYYTTGEGAPTIASFGPGAEGMLGYDYYVDTSSGGKIYVVTGRNEFGQCTSFAETTLSNTAIDVLTVPPYPTTSQVTPSGSYDVADIKLEWNSIATSWSNHPAEMYGKNYVMDEKGFHINSENNTMFIDEDEIVAKYQDEIIFKISEDLTTLKKIETRELNLGEYKMTEQNINGKNIFLFF